MKKIFIIIIVILGLSVLFFTQRSEEITVDHGADRDAVTLFDHVDEDDAPSRVRENGGYVAVEHTVGGVSFSFSIHDSWSTTRTPQGTLILHSSDADDPTQEAHVAIESFTANGFQVHESLSVFSRLEHSIVGQRAVTYVVSPNESASHAEIAWRNDSHKLTQVRLQEKNPSAFLVFVKNPTLSEAEFTRLLNSLSL